MVRCDFCGATPDGDSAVEAVTGERPAGQPRDAAGEPDLPIPLTWVSWQEHGGVRRCCDSCARTHVRDMEAKVDSTWW